VAGVAGELAAARLAEASAHTASGGARRGRRPSGSTWLDTSERMRHKAKALINLAVL
jgi:hypothetical protein